MTKSTDPTIAADATAIERTTTTFPPAGWTMVGTTDSDTDTAAQTKFEIGDGEHIAERDSNGWRVFNLHEAPTDAEATTLVRFEPYMTLLEVIAAFCWWERGRSVGYDDGFEGGIREGRREIRVAMRNALGI